MNLTTTEALLSGFVILWTPLRYRGRLYSEITTTRAHKDFPNAELSKGYLADERKFYILRFLTV